MHRPRLCARPGCGEAATATLSFQYASSIIWLDDLDDLGAKEPSSIDLCARHADRLAPPKGWTGHDRRSGGADAGRERPSRATAPAGTDTTGLRGDVRAQAS